MSRPNRKPIGIHNLRHIASSAEFQDIREPGFRIGDLVRLNSGGPIMMVVDIDGSKVTTAWATSGQVAECSWFRPCLHRVRDAW